MDLDEKIKELAEEGYGRNHIMRQVPEASEWRIRKILHEVRGPVLQPGLEEVSVKEAKPTVRNTEVVLNLKPLEFKLPRNTPIKPQDPGNLYTVVLFGDVHAPFHHEANIRVAQEVIRQQAMIRLDEVIAIGDIVDFYSVSRYDKNPIRRNQLQDELISAGTIMAQFTEVSLGAKKTYIQGNHEARLGDYIARNAPALASLPQLQLPALLGLESMGWGYERVYTIVQDSFLVKHGDYVAGASGASAKKEMDSAWLSGASGHVHRLAVHERTSWIHTIKSLPPAYWVETGCLCEPDPEYLGGRGANWQSGIVIIRFTEDGFSTPELVRIHNGRAMWHGRIIDAG